MAETQETIADIIAEKRRDAQHIRNNLSTVPVRRLDQLAEIKSLADEADRIEAALKREAVTGSNQFSDAAKLREAVVKCVNLITEFGNAEIVETPLDVIVDIEAILKAALTEQEGGAK